MCQKYALKLNSILENCKPLLDTIPTSEMDHKPKPDKWSKKEILGHLIDSAYNNHQRFIRAEKRGNLIFGRYDQKEWVVKNNYQNRDAKEIIALFIAVHFHISQLISSINEKDLKQTTSAHNFDKICMNQVEIGKPSSLGYLIDDYIFHLEHHLGQIVFAERLG